MISLLGRYLVNTEEGSRKVLPTPNGME